MTNEQIQKKIIIEKRMLEKKRDLQEHYYQLAQETELEADAIEGDIKGLENHLEEETREQ